MTRFQYLAGEMCRQATEGGTPVGRPPSDPRALQAYAAAALSPTMTITIALPRLAANNRRLTRVAPLMAHLETLVGLYRRTALGRPGAVSAGAISSAQQAAARSARSANLAQCAPVPGAPA